MLRKLRAYLALRRERHDPDLAEAFRARRETARVHAWWMREACDPEALRIAALMVERARSAQMAVTV